MARFELGVDRKVLTDILAAITSNATQSLAFSYGPPHIEITQVRTFVMSCADSTGDAILAANLVAGTHDVIRHRGGTNTTLVSAVANDAPVTDGLVTFTYTFADVDWNIGDGYTINFDGVGVVTPAVTYPRRQIVGFVTEIEDLNTNVDTILVDVAEIGTATDTDIATDIANVAAQIVALNDLSAANVNTEVDSALNTAVPEPPTAKAITDILHKDGSFTYAKATDSLEAIRDIIDALNNISTSDVNTQVDAALNTAVPEPPTANALTDILHKDGSFTFDNTTDSLEAIRDVIDALNNISTADVNTQVDAALDTAVPTGPTARSINDMMEKNSSGTFDDSTDSLEAISDKVGVPSLNFLVGESTPSVNDHILDTLLAVGGHNLASSARNMEAIGNWRADGTGAVVTADDATNFRSDAGSLKVDVTTITTGAELILDAGLNRAKPGATFYGSFWVFSTSANIIGIGMRRAGGAEQPFLSLDGVTNLFVTGQTLVANEWNHIEGFVTFDSNWTGGGSLEIHVYSRTAATWTYWLDDPTICLLDWSPIDARMRQIQLRNDLLPVGAWTKKEDSTSVTTLTTIMEINVTAGDIHELGSISILTPAVPPDVLSIFFSMKDTGGTYRIVMSDDLGAVTPTANVYHNLIGQTLGTLEYIKGMPDFFDEDIKVEASWASGTATVNVETFFRRIS